MNLLKARKYLDMAATDLDEKGHKDLADRIDQHVARLPKASKMQLDHIVADLKRISREADLRDGVDEQADEEDESPRASRLAALRRRVALRRRMTERRARTERPMRTDRLASLRQLRRERLERAARSDDQTEDDSVLSRIRRRAAIRRLREIRARRRDR